MRISDWSSDVCSSDLRARHQLHLGPDAGDQDTGPRARSGGAVVAAGDQGLAPQRASLWRSHRSRQGGDRGEAWRRSGEDLAPQLRHSAAAARIRFALGPRSEEHTSELQSLMRISYAVFCLKKKKQNTTHK